MDFAFRVKGDGISVCDVHKGEWKKLVFNDDNTVSWTNTY